jgi:hypothetical protein
LELPAHADGRRRNPLRRRGFATQEEVEAKLEQARALLALDEDPHVQRKITELMLSVLKDAKDIAAGGGGAAQGPHSPGPESNGHGGRMDERVPAPEAEDRRHDPALV